MSNQKDEQAFEDYLKGSSALSRHYRSESTEEPSARLDTEIITAAKESVLSKTSGAGSHGSRWYVPLSLAAVIVISFGVVFKIYDQESLPGNSKYPETRIENKAVMEDRMDQLSGKSESVLKDEMSEVKEKSDSKIQGLKRELAVPSAPAVEEDVGQSKQISEQEIQKRSSSQSSADKPAKILMREETMEAPAGAEFRKEQVPLSAAPEITNTLNPEQVFELINRLWSAGDRQGAYLELKNFIQAYPDYDIEELKKRIPVEMKIPGQSEN